MLFEITDRPIGPDALHNEVVHSGDGAVVTFCGVVRDHSDGRRTDYLVYEAYTEMAERKMAEIGHDAVQRFGVSDVAILHRVGRLGIGDVSVLIAVASPHRAEAFAACHHVVDRLKEVVPIWKKELGEDGGVWVEGPGTLRTGS